MHSHWIPITLHYSVPLRNQILNPSVKHLIYLIGISYWILYTLPVSPIIHIHSSSALLIYSISVNHNPPRWGAPHAWDAGRLHLYTDTSGRRLCYESRWWDELETATEIRFCTINTPLITNLPISAWGATVVSVVQ